MTTMTRNAPSTKKIHNALAKAKAEALAHDRARLRKAQAPAEAMTAAARAAAAMAPAPIISETEALFRALRDELRPAVELSPEAAETVGLASKIIRAYESKRAQEAHRAVQAAAEAARPKRIPLRRTIVNVETDVLVLALSRGVMGSAVQVDGALWTVASVAWVTPSEAEQIRAALAAEKSPTLALVEGDARWHLAGRDRYDDSPSILRTAGVEHEAGWIAQWLQHIECPRSLAIWAIDADHHHHRHAGVAVMRDADGIAVGTGARGASEVARACWRRAAMIGQKETAEAIEFWRARLAPTGEAAQ